MYHFFLIIFVIIAVTLVVLIMLQQNKNSDLGGIFENRSLGNILHSNNLNNGITRIIVILAILFFLFSLLLGNINSKQNRVYMSNVNQESSIKVLE